jgi:hypothetical protein
MTDLTNNAPSQADKKRAGLVAVNAFTNETLALAKTVAAVHKEGAFQASSPKTYTGRLRAALFLPDELAICLIQSHQHRGRCAPFRR